jgi:hypothetical protein
MVVETAWRFFPNVMPKKIVRAKAIGLEQPIAVIPRFQESP